MSELQEPSWLPMEVVALVRELLQERPDDAGLRALAFDRRLEHFWRHIVPRLKLTRDELSTLLGSFLVPLPRYTDSDKRASDEATFKRKVRDRQKAADELMDQAATMAKDLALILEDLELTSPHLPDQLRLLPLFREVTGLELDDVSDYYVGFRTYVAIDRLAKSLFEHPRADALFAEIPGMASQKVSWRDWLREALTNIADFERQRQILLELKEAHWVALTQALVSPHIGRSSVNAALRSFSPEKSKK